MKASALDTIAQEEAKSGRLAEAGETWEEATLTALQIADPDWMSLELSSIAAGQVNTGQLKAAAAAAHLCQGKVHRLEAYAGALLGYLESKNPKLKAALEEQAGVP